MFDEDFVIVIVGDENEEETQNIRTELKQEPLQDAVDSYYEPNKVEEIIKKAKTFGQEIAVKQEIIVEHESSEYSSDSYDPSSDDEASSSEEVSDDESLHEQAVIPPPKRRVKGRKEKYIKRRKAQYDDENMDKNVEINNVDDNCETRQNVNIKYVEDKIDSDKYILKCGISSDDEEYCTRSKKRIEFRMKVNHNNAVSKVIIKNKNYVQRLREKDPKYADTKELINKLVEIMTRVVHPEYPDNMYTLEFNDSIYCCTSCDYSCDKVNNIKMHYRIRHGPYYLVCYACGMEYNNTNALASHEERCRSPDAEIMLKARKLFRMKFPQGITTKTKKNRSNKDMESRGFICKFCSVSFCTMYILQAHENKHLRVKPYKCTHCEDTFYGYHAMRRHNQKNHSEKYYECDHCNKRFKNKDSLKFHLKQNHSSHPFPCDRCSKKFLTQDKFDLHLGSVHHDENILPKHICKFCEKRFYRFTGLVDHINVKHGMRVVKKEVCSHPFPCDRCSKKFLTQDKFDLHLGSVHHDENILPKHICKFCEKRFYRFTGLVDHINVKHGMRVVKKETWIEERLMRGETVQLVRESELKKSDSTL